jgi:hypothetical protein
LHACPHELRFDTKSPGGWLSHLLCLRGCLDLVELELQISILNISRKPVYCDVFNSRDVLN